MLDSLISYIHYLGFMSLFAALVAQHLLFRPHLQIASLRRIVVIDGVYGMSALVVLISGLLKVFAVGAPPAIYMANGFFHAKITVFFVAAGLSLWPTLQFLKARRRAQSLAKDQTTPGQQAITLPNAIAVMQRLQLVCIFLIPLLAAFMVRY